MFGLALRRRLIDSSVTALEWLERGYEIRDLDMPYIGAFSFILVPDGRVGPRYQDLLRRMNLPEN